MLAWLSAKHHGGELRLRVDDLDPRVSTLEHEEHQRRDLDALGITFDGPELRQSERTAAYTDAIASLTDLGLVYRCFCSRREIREAASAPHVHLPDGAYPGTCRDLSPAQRIERAKDRPAALRVRTENVSVEFVDRNYGAQKELIDDFVIQRNDGVASYNLATVLDDAQQGVTEVVRGADLLVGTARHVWLREVLELPRIEHAHVPLIMNTAGERLAKRDGAVTMFDLASIGVKADDVRARLACSLNLSEPGEAPTMSDLLSRYDPTVIPLQPWIWTD